MGDVYLAVHKGPGGFYKLAVIKELRSAFSEDGTSLRMFLDEARLAARLSHPNVVQTNEVAQEEGRHFMVMEYLEGKPFQHVLKRLSSAGGFPWAYRVHIVAEALKGLHYAHELKDFDGTPLNVVHRDFTPHNIFVTYEGVVKVLDFGIAKAVDSQETRTGMIKGKFAYMAPEQAMGKAIDRRTDIYSAGVVLWEAITGRRMWPNLSEVQILMHVVKEAAPSPKDVNPDVPDELVRICNRALERSPEDRYETAEQMRHELESFLESRQLTTTPAEIGVLLSRGFEADRQRIRGIIETAMRELRAAPDENTVVAVPTDSTATHSTIRPSSINSVPGMSDVRDLTSGTNSGLHSGHSHSLTGLPSMPTFSSVRRERSRGPLIGVLVGTSALAAGALYWAVNRASQVESVPVSAPGPQALASQAAPAAIQPPSEPNSEALQPGAAGPLPGLGGDNTAVPPLLPEGTGAAESTETNSPKGSGKAVAALDRTKHTVSGATQAEPEALDTPAAAAATPKTTTPQPGAPAATPSSGSGTSASPAPTVMAFSGGMNRPMLLSGHDPVYTPEARDARVEGTMVARCTITTTGSVTGCRLLKSLPHMDKSVLDALYSRRYTPVIWEGKPVAVSYTFNIRVVLPK